MKKIKVECEFCGGKGFIERFTHVEDGVCYGCKGKGYHLITEEQAKRVEEERQGASKFKMVLLPASYNTYDDREIIKSLGFKFKSPYGWIKIIEVESVEEAERVSGEVGAKAKDKGLHGVFLMDFDNLDDIQSPQHMQKILTAHIKKGIGI
ncbi:hypothetical protein KQUDLBSD_CDS0158 [Staphylococcus phage PG-2021_40]